MDGFNGIPALYDYDTGYNGCRISTIHARNTALSLFFDRYLLQQLFSVYEFDLPEGWDPDYFRYTLFVMGYTIVFNTDKFGVINNHGCIYGRNVYYRPTMAIVSNPLIRKPLNMEINKNCALIKMAPDYRGAYDVVSTFSDLLAVIIESLGVNVINSKLSYVFAADNKGMAESMKNLYDNVAGGQPATVVGKNLFDADGNPRWLLFDQDVKNHFVGKELLECMQTVKAMFMSYIGINTVSFEKKERLTNQEVNANNEETQAICQVWLESMQESIDKVNDMFDLNIKVRLRKPQEVPNVSNTAISDTGRNV